MAWVKLDDQIFVNPKMLGARPLAKLLYIGGLTYAAGQLTDGKLSRAAVKLIAAQTGAPPVYAEQLVLLGLWERHADGYAIHDYLDYNASRQQALALREQKAKAGRKGGWQKAGNPLAECQESATTPVHDPTPVPIPSPAASTPTERLPQKETPEAEHTPSGARDLAVRDSFEADFDAWWQAYPRREGKHAAKQSYEKRRKAGRSAEALLAAATNHAEHFEREGGELRYVKLPATFLNQRCDEEWEQGPPVPPAPSRPRPSPNGASVLSRNLANLQAITPGAGR